MPIYEYQCEDCGHQLEVMQRMSDDRLTTCPSCNKEALKKLISKVGFQLKGTGWYETDFKNSGKEKAGTSGNSDSGGKKTEKSSEISTASEKSGSDTKTTTKAADD